MSSNISTPTRFRKPFAEKNNEPFTIVLDSIDSYTIGRVHKDTYRKLVRLVRLCGGQCDWPVRRIAAYCDMLVETYKQHQRVLKRAGLIHVKDRSIPGCRLSDTNILTLTGGGVKKTPQRSTEKDLKTKAHTRENPRVDITPAKPEPETPPAPVQPSKARLEWEARREWDRECTRRMLASYEAVGRAIVTEQAERQQCRERNRSWWREGGRHRWDGGREHRREQGRQRCSQAQAEASALSYWERPDVIARIAKQDEDYLRENEQWIQSKHTLNTL
jgi:hypothetical protein